MIGGNPGYVPNPQERLFIGEEKGIELLKKGLEAIMFLQAVLIASLICSYFLQPIGSNFEVALYLLAWAEWPMMLVWMVPRVVSHLSIVSSIEYDKDAEAIEKVISSVKAERVAQTLRMLRLVKLEGRIKHSQNVEYGPDGEVATITENTFKECLQAFQKLSGSKRREIDFHYKVFDRDNNGTVGTSEIVPLFKRMGIIDFDQSAKSLMQLVDRNKDEFLELDEFRVLVMLATQRTSSEEEEEEFRQFFSTVDDDQSGKVMLDELVEAFGKMGMEIDENDLGELIYRCFGTAKMSLNMEDFVEWIRFCETVQQGL